MSNEHHDHSHSHDHHHHEHDAPSAPVLTVRAHSGLSGDMFLAGLLRMTEISPEELEASLVSIMPELSGCVQLVRKEVNHLGGWHAQVTLPHQHEHRTLADILTHIAAGGMSDEGRRSPRRPSLCLPRPKARFTASRLRRCIFTKWARWTAFSTSA